MRRKKTLKEIDNPYFADIKKQVLLMFSVVSLVVGISYMVYSFTQNKTTHVILISVLIVIFATSIYLVTQTGYYRLIIEIYVNMIGVTALCLVYLGGKYNAGIFSLFVYPVVTIFLKGSKKGKYFILSFLTIMGIITLLQHLHIFQTAYSTPHLLLSMATYFIISVISYFYDRVRINSEEETQALAFIDSLTGLPNRNRLIQDIQALRCYGLCIIDIDRFKELTGFYGSYIGDAILKEVSLRLQSFNRNSAHIVRYKLHADEFSLIWTSHVTEAEVEEYIRTLNLILESPYIIEDQEINVRVTYGISLGDKYSLEQADMALRNARNTQSVFTIYNDSLHIIRNYENNLLWSRKIDAALESDRIVPFFQAIMNNHNGKIEKYECLVRMIDEDKKIVTPYHFLEISKKTRSYFHITELMIKKALEYFQNLPYLFSVNLSMLDLQNKYFYGVLEKKVKDFPDPGRLILELTETERISELGEVKEFIHNIHSLGCRISIDDFGTGYSNFAYLLELDIDFLKIDGSLIKNIHRDSNNRIIVENIVNFCKELQLQTIAEFVENQEIQDVVRSMGVDFSQGYFLGKPGPDINHRHS